MMREPDIHAAFEKLRPVCVQCTKEHSRENVRKLIAALQHVEPKALQELQEYTLFPLRFILKQPQVKSQELHTDVVDGLHTIICKTEIQQVELFQDLFNSLCILISSNDTQSKVAPVCEELKLAVVKCLGALVGQMTHSVAQQVYVAQFLPPLGHAVHLLLHFVEVEQMRQLRVEALKALLELSLVNRKVGMSLLVASGNMFASFLPGIAITVAKVITGDPKQGQQVTTVAVETWYKMVSLVLGDLYLKKSKATAVDIQGMERSVHGHGLTVERSEGWVTATADKLKVLTEKVLVTASHSNWRVRASMVDWAHTLLINCTSSLTGSVAHFLEVLVRLVGDDYSRVAAKSREALDEFQLVSMTDENTQPLVETLEDSLHALTTALPRLIRTADDEKKHATLCLLKGYLQLLGPRLDSLLHSHCHLQRLGLALIQVTELDISHLQIIEEKTTGSPLTILPEDEHHMRRPPKYFKHFVDNKIYQDIVVVCRLLGYYGDLNVLTDHLLELFHQSSVHRKQATLVLNEVILGVRGQGLEISLETTQTRTEEGLENLIWTLLEDYLAPEHFKLETTSPSGESNPQKASTDLQIVAVGHKTTSSLELTKSNILQVCLLLEGIGNCAQVLGPGFRGMLMEVLYPVLERLGDDVAIISHTAHLVLKQIATACTYRSVEELLCLNADYLVNSVSLRLRYLGENPKAPLVLQVVLKYSGAEILPLVKDTIHEVIAAVDRYYDVRAVMFMKVLMVLVTSITRWHHHAQDASAPASESSGLDKAKSRQESLRDYILDYIKEKQVADGESEPSNLQEDVQKDEDEVNHTQEKEDVEDGDYSTPEEKKEPPSHVVMVKEVLERCRHLLASPDPRLRLLVLDTVARCCQAIQAHQDELLPLLHKVWPPFVQRFSDEEQLVAIKAIETLGVMGAVSGDFLHQRLVADVLPKMCSTLHRLAKSSVQTGPACRWTTACKLQQALLACLGRLSSQVGLEEDKLVGVLRAVLPYLSARQSPVLQEASVAAFEHFVALDGDTVWLLLCELYCPETMLPPHSCFKTVKMAGSNKRNEFSDNIVLILNLL